MRRDLRILLGTIVCAGAVVAYDYGSEAVADMRTFRVREVEVRGVRLLAEDEVRRMLAVQESSSVWTDPQVWVERVERHPMVKDAEVSRRLPGGLVVSVTERRPVALAPTPVLEPVDAEGYRLPVDPARHRLDLPVLATDREPARGARLFPAEVRALAGELGRMMSADTAFLQMVSELGWEDDGTLRVSWTEPPVDFLLPAGTPHGRLQEGLSALADAVGRSPTDPPEEIDLRFADQVVVRRTRND